MAVARRKSATVHLLFNLRNKYVAPWQGALMGISKYSEFVRWGTDLRQIHLKKNAGIPKGHKYFVYFKFFESEDGVKKCFRWRMSGFLEVPFSETVKLILKKLLLL